MALTAAAILLAILLAVAALLAQIRLGEEERVLEWAFENGRLEGVSEGYPRARFDLRGRPAEVYFSAFPHARSFLAVRLTPPSPIRLLLTPSTSRFKKMFPAERCLTGHKPFDEAFLLFARPPEAAPSLLDHETRALLLESPHEEVQVTLFRDRLILQVEEVLAGSEASLEELRYLADRMLERVEMHAASVANRSRLPPVGQA
jgi:hypothetical protein